MFKVLLDILLNLVATIIQIIVWPINSLMTNIFPDLSTTITDITTTLVSIFNGMSWAISGIPTTLKVTLLFMLGIEIAKHTIFRSTYMLTRVWTIFQKIKFW